MAQSEWQFNSGTDIHSFPESAPEGATGMLTVLRLNNPATQNAKPGPFVGRFSCGDHHVESYWPLSGSEYVRTI
jgi:hypothetical protein